MSQPTLNSILNSPTDDIQVVPKWLFNDDDRLCPVCNELGLYDFPPMPYVPVELYHPKFGLVWSISGPIAHYSHGMKGECRCGVDFEVKVLVDGEYVDYGLARTTVDEILVKTEQIKANMALIQASNMSGVGGGDEDLWRRDRFNMYNRSLFGLKDTGQEPLFGGRASDVTRAYRIAQMPAMADRVLSGNFMTYDVLRMSRWSGLASAIPIAAIVAVVAPIVIREVKQLWDQLHMAEIQTEKYRLQQTEREFYKQWQG